MTRYMQHIADGTIYVRTAAIESDPRLRALPDGFDPRTMQVPALVAGVDIANLPPDARAEVEAILARHGMATPMQPVMAAQQAQPVSALPATIDGFENVPPALGALPVERAVLHDDDPVDVKDDDTAKTTDQIIDPLTPMDRSQLLEFAKLNGIKIKIPANAQQLRDQIRAALNVSKAAA